MKITAKSWNNYIGKLAKVNQKAGSMMRKYVEAHGVENTKALMNYAMALIQKYGEGSAELACQMYDAMAELSGVNLPSAEPAEIVKYKEVAKMVNATKSSIDQLERGVERLVKKAGADTTLKNAERDNAEFAWIPHGDTCAYCLALAAQGWRHVSLNTVGNGYGEHIHANCDCEYAVRFNKKTTVQGYDPDKYAKIFKEAEGSTEKEKINSLRRGQYQQKKENLLKEETTQVSSEILKFAKQGNTFVIKSDKLYEYTRKIKPLEGYEDIVVHGDAYSLAFVDENGKESNVSAEEFCNIIEKAGVYKGGKIRLISCQTGTGSGIVPTYMAKRFNTEILAPTEVVNVDSKGNMVLADDPINARIGVETGEWIKFNKDGRMK